MIIKLPPGVWSREHDGGVSMVVLQLFDDAFDVHLHEHQTANPIPDGRRLSLEDACARADAFLAERGHRCSASCGSWRKTS
jgi:hypothetical protein